jgi:hypothetical protein
MKSLLDFEFAPIAFGWGFFEATQERVAEALVSWRSEHRKWASKEPVCAPLREALHMLEPLTYMPERELLLATSSSWTAYFDNSNMGNSPLETTSYLALKLSCQSLALNVVPNTIRGNKPGIYGAVQFELFGPYKTDWLNSRRAITAMNDGGRWVFEEQGEILSFEKPERYLAKRIKDRFTSEMLEDYCAAFGLDIFNEQFYGPNGTLVMTEAMTPEKQIGESLLDARKRIGFDQ